MCELSKKINTQNLDLVYVYNKENVDFYVSEEKILYYSTIDINSLFFLLKDQQCNKGELFEMKDSSGLVFANKEGHPLLCSRLQEEGKFFYYIFCTNKGTAIFYKHKTYSKEKCWEVELVGKNKSIDIDLESNNLCNCEQCPC